MCFSPKVKIPKQNTETIKAVEPAPLTDTVKGVEFGGQAPEDELTPSEVGVKSTTVKKEENSSAPKSGGIRASIKSKVTKK